MKTVDGMVVAHGLGEPFGRANWRASCPDTAFPVRELFFAEGLGS